MAERVTVPDMMNAREARAPGASGRCWRVIPARQWCVYV